MLLGRGSCGTSVYIGVLQDGKEVAVKRVLIPAGKHLAENEKEILSSSIQCPHILSYLHLIREGSEVIEAINNRRECRFKRKSDIQVTGMIAFFVLTKGEHPFGEKSDRMRNILKGNAVSLKKLSDRNARKFVSLLISNKIENRPYAHEALGNSFMIHVETYNGPPKPIITSR